jgi:hypothetical protein
MVGAPKASAGGYGITSLPRSTGTETTKAPGGGKAAEKAGGGREAHNPVLQRLMADGFEGQGAQGKGLALGHHKHAEKMGGGKKAGKGGEAGEAPEAGQAPKPGEAYGAGKTPAAQAPGGEQAGLQKLMEDLMNMIRQFQAAAPGATPAPNGNTGIVPPGAI